MTCFIIAEAGVNHNGDLELAKELIHAAKETGAHAVKFQTFRADSLVTKTAQKAAYQQRNEGQSRSQHEMLQALELSEEHHHVLMDLANSLNIEFMSTGFDESAVDFLVDLGVKRLKVPSGEITNIPYLRHMAQKKLPVILSTGMCTLNEVRAAIDVFQSYYGSSLKESLVLLHCTSNYPALLHEVNLKAMCTLAQEFDVPVGYSDHTLGDFVPTLAVALGACVLEKHFTLDKSLKGPDHAASMNVDEFKKMVQRIEETYVCLGDGVKNPVASELLVRDLVRKSVTLKHALKQGSVLSYDDLILLRPGTGICPAQLEQVLGKRLAQDLPQETTLLWEHVL